MTVTIARPASTEHAPYYGTYISQVPDGSVLSHLEQQSRDTIALLRRVNETKSQYRYAPDKWNIREVIGHLIDAERVFAYRALSFGRADATPLPSFDENAWGRTSNAAHRPMPELIAEFEAVRASTLALFRGFSETEFARQGTASNNPVTVRALAYIIAGHERHHVRILKERYGVS
ncbi:MAG TPA: DinB family protein [Gemmatimonadaceae bacterium]|nr:DinB family protein [Gemmatimonadaceae bacterium]